MDARITLVAGGYLGDEGKGKTTQLLCDRHLARRREGSAKLVCIRSGGGTNTGATVYVSGTKLGIHMLPVGAFMPDVDAYIGTGCYVNLEILEKELALREHTMLAMGMPHFGRVFLSKDAHIVLPEYLEEDKEKEAKQKLGSTRNGVSVAAGYKYRYAGKRVENCLQDKSYWNNLASKYYLEVVDPIELFETTIKGYSFVIEGTQGIGLDVNHGFQYPYVSAGSFSAFGLLDGVGYALAPDDICMVLKSYGSYFGPTRMGAADFDDNDFRQFAGEFGTTTGRPRNLCWLDGHWLRHAKAHLRPSMVALNRVDTLNWFAENNKSWSMILEDGHRLVFDDRAVVDGKLTSAAALFIQTIEEYLDAPVKYVGIGPKHTDVIER